MSREERQHKFARIDAFLDQFHRESPILFNIFAGAAGISMFFFVWLLWDVMKAIARTQ